MTLFNRYLSRYEQSREENLTLQELSLIHI